MKAFVGTIAVVLMALALALAARQGAPGAAEKQPPGGEHVYATWETMEFDKCVAAWLILKYIDEEARFVFHAQGSEIEEGVVFDVPGAAWSRKHRKCASDCLMDEIATVDAAAARIVEIAHHIELNAWHLDDFPEAKRRLADFREIAERNGEASACLREALGYIDDLYAAYKKGQ